MAGVGDVGIQGSDTEGNYARITNAARVVVEHGALIIVIGDDHSISYPLGRGMEPLGEFDSGTDAPQMFTEAMSVSS